MVINFMRLRPTVSKDGRHMKRDLTDFPCFGLRVGQAVDVHHGPLAGVTGVLIGYSPGQNCRIELDTAQRGVLLVIDPSFVEVRAPVATLN
jgi:hypothetical protein